MHIYRIAIDGPSGAGKSTIARSLAQRLDIEYIDSGAMYRAIALKLLRTGTDYNNPEDLARLLDNTEVDFSSGSIYLDGENVDGLIRTQEISELASASSTIQTIRNKLVAIQQDMGKRKSVIMDGRDIATKVFPDAEIKFYLTASPKVRAQRRALDMQRLGQPSDAAQIEKEIMLRDERDMNRANSPLTKTLDAIEIDTGKRSLEGNVEEAMRYVKAYLKEQGE